jgi:hypothetical protein
VFPATKSPLADGLSGAVASPFEPYAPNTFLAVRLRCSHSRGLPDLLDQALWSVDTMGRRIFLLFDTGMSSCLSNGRRVHALRDFIEAGLSAE